MRSLKKEVCCTVGLILLLRPSAGAQSVTARLTGTVKDSTGFALPGATVVVQSVNSGRTWQTLTQRTG
ncbi:MAG TPA: carboxypeptidase-like regulatory domain-containing protein, partial [Gemmatimonadales bacterium]|nr:carboxypeptidase-like regulatory domain-containing protein [Gemmatimonadales bacterium]